MSQDPRTALEAARDALKLIRNHSSVSLHQIECIDPALATVTAALSSPPVLPAKCMRCGAPSPLTDCMDVACPHPTAPQASTPALDDARDEQAWIDAVRTAEHLCPTDRPHLDRLRWKALHIRAAMQQEPRS